VFEDARSAAQYNDAVLSEAFWIFRNAISARSRIYAGRPTRALTSQFDPGMVRSCVARGLLGRADVVLHQFIRPVIGARARGHRGYQRACDLISGQASTAPKGSPVFARAGKTNPPSRLVLSQTSVG